MPEMFHLPAAELDKARMDGKLDAFVKKKLTERFSKQIAEAVLVRVLDAIEKACFDIEEFEDAGHNKFRKVFPRGRPNNTNRLTIEIDVPKEIYKVGNAYWTMEVRI